MAAYTLQRGEIVAYPPGPEACAELPLTVSRVRYSAQITLTEELYSDRRGYYVVYERCCRNNAINNLARPGEVGQAFYLQFPSPYTQTDVVHNSSPVLPTFPAEYLLLNRPWEYNLTATDADGDELRYSLVTPLTGNSSPNTPVPITGRPQPYATRPYTINGVIPGPNGGLQLNGSRLSVTPSQTGLYVVAVKVEEFRNSQKIGEVRREFQVVVYAPQNQEPELLIQQNGEPVSAGANIQVGVGQTLRLQLTGSDADGDRLTLVGNGQGFQLSSYGIQFFASEGVGEVTSSLVYTPDCHFFRQNPTNPLTITFTVNDENLCRSGGRAVQQITIEVILPDDFAPTLSADLGQGEMRIDTLHAELLVGQTLEATLFGEDRNFSDRLWLELLDATLPLEWPLTEGVGSVQQSFSLPVTCEMLLGQPERPVGFTFVLRDEGCLNAATDTLHLAVVLKQPLQNFEQVIFPNMFSPNGDDINEAFYIENLPENVCTNSFEYVRIYNRWGKILFVSTQPNFRWLAHNVPDGVYYYEIKYSNWEYTSFLALMRGKTAVSAGQNP